MSPTRSTEEQLYAAELRSWLGRIWVVTSNDALRFVLINEPLRTLAPKPSVTVDESSRPIVLRESLHQIAEYFDGKRRVFDLPLDPRGTSFQREVWRETLNIPYGSTRTYASLAASLGVPDGARAVGSALASNPVPIVIPCHRVIRSDGTSGGYTKSPALKVMLLEFEHNNVKG
ncbi:MAG: methylated-DNA--[protein]-cysteine S-methyltransferase [Thaumarchaeota archaeon]|nr:methylated-DNA--[protein]-cysteine S-methyltransferase [Candidatus Calditenuaceae archaeon]MDW8187244.1 methylated-DNA--[protein]-cysteine S-methyltransferase [Nitrososphaerota archaeon]